MTDDEIKENLPPVLSEIFKRISVRLKDSSDEEGD